MIIRLDLRLILPCRIALGGAGPGLACRLGSEELGSGSPAGSASEVELDSDSPAGLVLVFDEQPQRLSGPRQNPDGAGPPRPDRVGVAADRENLSDPVHRRQKPDRITCRRLRHNGFQPILESRS